ncbi:hypothetical protein BC940DRAFT_289427 [Gongronella butleri]|nr:hypothetical protein BC940DRAFT_289427 [Gongronella butleri]
MCKIKMVVEKRVHAFLCIFEPCIKERSVGHVVGRQKEQPCRRGRVFEGKTRKRGERLTQNHDRGRPTSQTRRTRQKAGKSRNKERWQKWISFDNLI